MYDLFDLGERSTHAEKHRMKMQWDAAKVVMGRAVQQETAKGDDGLTNVLSARWIAPRRAALFAIFSQ